MECADEVMAFATVAAPRFLSCERVRCLALLNSPLQVGHCRLLSAFVRVSATPAARALKRTTVLSATASYTHTRAFGC